MYNKELEDYKADSSGMAILKAIQRLIMISSHPRLLDPQLPQGIKVKNLISESKKLENTIDILNEIKFRKEKVVIFTKYKKMQVILKRVIYEIFGIDVKIINGDAICDRFGVVEDFNKKEGFNILILSPKAAGVGLNITGANHVIHYTREWNPAIENQATDRTYRLGQKLPVTVYFPIATCEGIFTVEEKLDDLLNSKKKLMRDIIIPTNLDIKVEELEVCLFK
jgi:SNF2 family DNA or RNA helicase